MTPDFEQAEYLHAPPVVSAEFDNGVFLRSIAFGLVGALVGALVYGAFVGITHIQIGYLSIGVAYLVAKAMMMGSNNRGGLPYQVTAIVLTCTAVAFGNALMVWWDVKPIPFTAHNLLALAKYGFAEPFLEFQTSPGSALLGLFILFVGLRAAWRMASGIPGAVRHPFSR